MKKMIYKDGRYAGCYFRSTVKKPELKVLLQITERCNLHCKHCFNSSINIGDEISYQIIEEKIIPKLVSANVTRVTLTGGEPMVHPEVIEIITAFIKKGIHITLCTNGTGFSEEIIDRLYELGNVHINVSLDGFSFNSHGRFRGFSNEQSFNRVLHNIRMLGKRNLLNGILCAPNHFSDDEEYINLCKFAKENHARYVLFNPLSKFGRGNETQNLSYTMQELINLRKTIEASNLENETFQIVFIRIFKEKASLNCEINCDYEIPYIFVNGSVAVCPYMVFATDSVRSKYQKKDFLYGNILEDGFNLPYAMKHYSFLNKEEFRKRGCIASKITNGLRLIDFDNEIYNVEEK